MNRDTFAAVTERSVDYAHLPGQEHNPLMESTAHVDWGLVLLNSARHTLAGTDLVVWIETRGDTSLRIRLNPAEARDK